MEGVFTRTFGLGVLPQSLTQQTSQEPHMHSDSVTTSRSPSHTWARGMSLRRPSQLFITRLLARSLARLISLLWGISIGSDVLRVEGLLLVSESNG